PAGGAEGAGRLTGRGRKKIRAAAAGRRALGVAPAIVLTSPLVRAVETAAIVVAALQQAPAPRELAALTPDVAPADTLKALRVFARHQDVMIVGHEPNLSRTIAFLLCGATDGASIELKKGASPAGRRSTGSCSPGCSDNSGVDAGAARGRSPFPPSACVCCCADTYACYRSTRRRKTWPSTTPMADTITRTGPAAGTRRSGTV